MKKLYIVLSLLLAVVCFAQSGKNAPTPKLIFKEGALYAVEAKEVLKITMQSSQVEDAMVEPSTRMSNYYFTERVEKVYSDGSADLAATLDSFTTKIYIGTVDERNEYFRFNSSSDYDIANRLKDIKALPRAQFLGQTLKYTLRNDGQVRSFENLRSFQSDAMSRSFDYDLLQAMLSLSDSLRVGQLLEQGFGAITAAASPKGEARLPYTITEVHATKSIKAKTGANGVISFAGSLIEPPSKIGYLEGMAWSMELTNFTGGTFGAITVKNGIVTNATTTDTASFLLNLDTERIKDAVHRVFTVRRRPIVMSQGTVTIKETKSHKAEWKPPEEKIDPDAINVDVNSGQITYPTPKQDSTKK